MGIPCAAILEWGYDYLIKVWIEGTRGDIWFTEWKTKGWDVRDRGFLSLLSLLSILVREGVYVHNLKPMNLVWKYRSEEGEVEGEREWVIVDPGPIYEYIDHEEERNGEEKREGEETREMGIEREQEEKDTAQGKESERQNSLEISRVEALQDYCEMYSHRWKTVDGHTSPPLLSLLMEYYALFPCHCHPPSPSPSPSPSPIPSRPLFPSPAQSQSPSPSSFCLYYVARSLREEKERGEIDGEKKKREKDD